MSNGITAWSYSRYNCYQTCPFQFKCKFIDKLPEEKSSQMERGLRIHKELEKFLNSEGALPEEAQSFSAQFSFLLQEQAFAEMQMAFTQAWKPTGWFKKDTWLRVILDAGLIYDDNTADVIDFKTGKKYGENEEQMELFAVATFNRFPLLTEVKTRLWYLDGGDEDVVDFRAADRLKLRDKWEKKVQPLFADTMFAPRPNDKCKWCSFGKSKGGPCRHG